MSLTREQAALIISAFEAATDGNWPNTRDALTDAGHKPKEVEKAFKSLADAAGQSNPVSAGDF